MKHYTNEYIEFFDVHGQTIKLFDNLFDAITATLSTEDAEEFNKLRTAFDMNGLLSRTAENIESLLNQEELNEIILLYRKNPVLMKALKQRDTLFALEEQAARELFQDALARMQFVVPQEEC
jgi:hypothetical protein